MVCDPVNPASTCEVGDLAGLFGALSFDAGGKSMGFFTATNLPLSGGNSVGGRSIVVHAANGGGSRVGCADTARVARADFSYGTILFIQVRQLYFCFNLSAAFRTLEVTETCKRWLVLFSWQASVLDSTHVSMSLTGVEAVGGYHVHTFPLTSSSCSSAAGHYNPLKVSQPVFVFVRVHLCALALN